MLETCQLLFDKACHSYDDVQRAAYKFIDRCSVVVSVGDSQIVCDVELDEKCTQSVDLISQQIRKEVLDQTLRSRIRSETEDVRNLILAHAFSRTGLANSPE
ncbi:His-Xaa-Ser system protein HxsD [Achromobacter sp. Marseille-Q4962]|uniref:His-Xaa-Ser system protein HxsD n=1 Tax=Achromobacter sp. Marseille-Q4962 TaxID=2942202 RepID=UPI0020738253|nr:His-Xaa-Ser system protein HxsD [Achromobacter sp. Marseille-Q4962]